jgi:erythromycin esterase-like protein
MRPRTKSPSRGILSTNRSGDLLLARHARFAVASCAYFLSAATIAGTIDAKELRPHSSTFSAVESSQFEFLRDHANNSRIIGIGESTHGTADYTDLAREMLEFLATQCGYNTIIIEASVGEAAYLNEYVLSRRDDLTHILTEINTSWRYQTVQFVELIEWIREYNRSHKDSPVEIHGMEMQIVAADAARLRAYLELVGDATPVPAFEKHLWQPISRTEHLEQYQQIQAVLEAFDANRQRWINSQGEPAYQVASHHAEVIKQFVLASAQTREQRKHDLRDLYMSENVEWTLWHRGRNSKALIWAHNAHIADGVDNGIVDVLGHQLRKRFGNAYYAIATDFGTGSFYAFPSNANEVGWTMQLFHRTQIEPGTFTATLNELGNLNVFVDLRAAQANGQPLSCILKSPVQMMTGAGAQKDQTETRPYLIGTKFDAVIHLAKTRPIEWLKPEASD